MPHIIGKQIIELNLSNAKNAFRLQQEVSQLYWQRIIKELEVIFDQIAPGKDWIHINRLEIDLGDLSTEQLLKGQFLTDLKRKIEAALKDLEINEPQQIKKQSATQTVFQQWLYFLNHGFFENHQSIPTKDWENQLLKSLIDTPARLRILQREIQVNQAVISRVIGQHSTRFVQQLIALATNEIQNNLATFIEEWQQLLTKAEKIKEKQTSIPIDKVIQHHFWEFALTTCFAKMEKQSAARLIGTYLQDHFDTPLFKTIWQVVEKEKTAYPSFQNLVQQADFWESSQLPKLMDVTTKKQQQTKKNLPNSIKENRQSTENKLQANSKEENLQDKFATYAKELSSPQEKVSENLFASSKQNTWYIPNAGVILLHPFLMHFFKKMDLLEDGKFKTEAERHKAILLIEYLANKDEKIPEYNLVLAKLLCGLPLNAAINYLISPNKEEKEEAENLLQAAIDHWGALKSASPDGLRDGFLRRTGLLKKSPTGWKLQIEQQTMDLLLDKLPWGLGVVKLPFMKELLKVEWR